MATTADYSPAVMNVTMKQGDQRLLELQIMDLENPSTPTVLTGATLLAQLRLLVSPGQSIVVGTLPTVLVDGPTGVVSVLFPEQVTAIAPLEAPLRWELQYTLPTGEPHTPVGGRFRPLDDFAKV